MLCGVWVCDCVCGCGCVNVLCLFMHFIVLIFEMYVCVCVCVLCASYILQAPTYVSVCCTCALVHASANIYY